MMVMTNSPAHPESQTSGAVRNCNNNCLGGEGGEGLEELNQIYYLLSNLDKRGHRNGRNFL